MHFMGFNDYQGDGDRNNGLAAVLSSLLFVGSAVLIYFLKLKDASHLAEAIVLRVISGIFFLAGIVLFIHGLVALAGSSGKPRNSGGNAFINTDPLAGILAFILSVVFTLTAIFFWYPLYQSGEDEVGVWFFSVFAFLLFFYALSVLLVNIRRK